MKLTTTRFGEITVDDRSVIDFPKGLHGFPVLKRFLFFTTTDLGLFRWLQSVEVPSLACLVTNPRLVVPDYSLRLPVGALSEIQLLRPDQADVLVVLAHPNDRSLMTADLQRPIILNRPRRLAMQVVLPEDSWSRTHRVFPDVPVKTRPGVPKLPPTRPLELSA